MSYVSLLVYKSLPHVVVFRTVELGWKSCWNS